MVLKLKWPVRIRTSLDTYQFMRLVLNREILEIPIEFNLDKEHFWVIALNRAHITANLELISLGSNSQVVVNPVEVFGLPIYKKASGVILVHNHPSGLLEPSEEDKDMTDHLIQCGKLMHAPVWDHVIITEHSYYSFTDSGLLERLSNSLKYVLPYELEKQFHKEMEREVKRLKKQAQSKIEKSVAIGRKEGLTEGEKIGIEKGKEEGIKEGKEIGKEEGMQQVARSMLQKGFETKAIHEITGISLQQIEQIKTTEKL